MPFILDFASNTISTCFFFFFLFIDLSFLIPAAIAQIVKLVAELVTPIGIPIKEARAELEIHPVIQEGKIRKRSI